MHKLTRKILLAILAIALHPAMAQDRPNILWIVSEDNTILLGSYGDQFATTPNLDRFASESIRYKNAFSTAPRVCAFA
ncbi:hypothetical protein [Dyadobacter sp. 676]|uniref:Sulfatase-like hydrolase/transferase n=1 Tax=Dyadobacter sp. 676 TaxID=3088362 RepID=A0AAU8FFZ8_9BACT